MESDSPIRINQRDGTLYVDGRLDREVTPIIRLKVFARDGGIFEGEEVTNIEKEIFVKCFDIENVYLKCISGITLIITGIPATRRFCSKWKLCQFDDSSFGCQW